ncbi:DNA-3-methyladenine glycosylase family protein [Metabacillus herbersteinensis]|uniref:DNA-3-methyladenine glycosylase II n=1 Tax=Metabacillus herbersteinensis TaxID=283816 RepID=A0ABV6GH35_9BACI
MWRETVEVEPPYDFDRILDRLSNDPLNAINMEAREIAVPLYDKENQPFVVTVKATGTKAKPTFEISGKADTQKEFGLGEIRRIFQWDFSLSVISNHFELSNIAEVFKEHEGTPLVLDFDLYSCLMKCIVHQQLNLSFAHTLTKRFVQTYGFELDGVWFYPKPEIVAALSYDDLRALQFSGRKAEYAIDTSKMIVEGTLNFNELPSLSDEEILKKLIKIRGVGPWTVQNLLLFGLGRPNLFPKADIGIQNALKKHFNLEKKPTQDEMADYSKEWEPYLSYASLYLWRSIE